MTHHGNKFWLGFVVVAVATCSSAQKVKVGYDKSVDFSKYKTYTWVEPGAPPARPVLYATVVRVIDSDLSSKGLQKIDKNGDLTLKADGGVEFGIAVSSGTPVISTYSAPPPVMNTTMWTGGQLMPAVPDASLQLQFIDRSANQIVWSGTVTEKLDIEHKEKSLELASKAVTKLLKQFPPPSSHSK